MISLSSRCHIDKNKKPNLESLKTFRGKKILSWNLSLLSNSYMGLSYILSVSRFTHFKRWLRRSKNGSISYTSGENINWCSTCKGQFGNSLQNWIWSAKPLVCIYPINILLPYKMTYWIIAKSWHLLSTSLCQILFWRHYTINSLNFLSNPVNYISLFYRLRNWGIERQRSWSSQGHTDILGSNLGTFS